MAEGFKMMQVKVPDPINKRLLINGVHEDKSKEDMTVEALEMYLSAKEAERRES